MQLVENPTELINALYHHDSILQLQKKDINKLCGELAQLYEIELLTLQNKLLRKWLAYVGNSSFNEGGDVNETVYEDFIGSPTTNDEKEFASDENVIRAHYILSSWKSLDAMDFLATELGTSSGENQLQLFECFAKLVDNKSESYMELINPNDFLLAKCCQHLKTLGLNYKPEKFKDMEKVEILKRVWTSHYNNSKGLEVMSFICLGFDIHLPQIWNGILKQMVALKMVQHLSILVEILSTKSKLLHLSSLKLAWECVMKEPLLHATKVRSYEQEVKLSKTFILLQKCPISTFLDLSNLIELCLRVERPHMAAIFVAFVNEKNREKFVKALEAFDKRELRKEIEELEEMGVAPVVTKSVASILKL
jgi:kinetochore-associated protein 1